MSKEDNIQNKIDALTDNMISCMKIHEELDKKLVKRIRLMPEIKKNFDFVAKNETSVESEYFCAGFVEGADWRINSIWHDVNEKPRRNTWYIAQIGNDAFDTFTDSENWDNYALGLNMIRWAYIEDLIPNMEDKA